jgi:hypothetical protein
MSVVASVVPALVTFASGGAIDRVTLDLVGIVVVAVGTLAYLSRIIRASLLYRGAGKELPIPAAGSSSRSASPYKGPWIAG